MSSIIEILESRDEKFLLNRMLDNIAFFDVFNKKISSIAKKILKDGTKEYKLLISDTDINITFNNRVLCPKNTMLSMHKNIAANPLENKLWRIYANNIVVSMVEVDKLKITSNSINKIVGLLESNVDNNEKMYHLPPLFLPQTNIFGLSGGIFLQILLDMGYKIHSLLIFEEHIELFYISMFFINYKQLFNQVSPESCYIFIQGITNKAFLNHYFYSKKITNNFLRLELNIFISDKINAFKNMVNEAYKANSRGWGSFEDELIGIKNSIKNIKNYKVLQNINKINIPICVVGSGPSLEDRLDFLKENEDNMIIFSCGTALKILKDNNIKVDFQIEIERVPYLKDVLKKANLCDTNLIAASVVGHDALSLSKHSYLFFRGGSAGSYLIKNNNVIEFCAPFVGNAGFSLACQFSNEIILCGLDCGYIEGRSKHSRGSFYGEENRARPLLSFLVEGNSSYKVYSDSIFSLSKESLELSIKYYKPKYVYNIGFGAFIKGSIKASNLVLNYVNKFHKDACIKAIQSCFLNISYDTNFSDILEFCNSLKEKLSCEISTKEELFLYVDLITSFLSSSSIKNPYVGILFEGSIYHLLQNMLVCATSIKSNNIKEFCRYCIDIIKQSIDEFYLLYKENILDKNVEI